jgi:hypothetical protein
MILNMVTAVQAKTTTPAHERRRDARPDTGPNRDDRYAFHVIDVGVDTIGFAFRNLASPVCDAFTGRYLIDQDSGVALPVRGGDGMTRYATDERGVTVGATKTPRGDELFWVESRLSPLLSGEVADRSLACPGAIPDGEVCARTTAARLGIPLDANSTATVRRADLAGDTAFHDDGDAHAFLHALNTLDLPRCKRSAITARGESRLEAVHWSNAGGVVVRAYDRGRERLERRQALPMGLGTTIRAERQLRPAFRDQLPPASFAAQDFTDVFLRGLSGWPEAIVAGSLPGAWQSVKGSIGQPLPGGKILTLRRAERVMGSLVLLAAEGNSAYDTHRVASERRRELRSLGLTVDDAAYRAVPVGIVISAIGRKWQDA